jgi:hypothetical protein
MGSERDARAGAPADRNLGKTIRKGARGGSLLPRSAPPLLPPLPLSSRKLNPRVDISISDELELIRVVDVKNEPPYTVIQAHDKDLPIRTAFVGDFIQYSVDITKIGFSPTAICQTRVAEIQLTGQ